jgi:dipeptidyl aminopeptidase/acylaminoacyl peptidase
VQFESTVALPRAFPRFRLLAFLVAAIGVTGVLFVLSTASSAAYRWTHPIRTPAAQTPEAYGLAYEEAPLTTEDGLHLAAWYLPSSNGAAIILLHGLGGNRGGDLGVARGFVDRGYGVLIPDLRAHGESEGSVSTLGLNEVRDVRAALGYLQQRPDVDAERIGIYGASLGAAVAIMAAAEMPELKVVVADSSFASVEWLVRYQFEKLDQAPAWLAPAVVAIGGWQAGVDAREIAPVRRVGRISPRPLMIMHGELDETFVAENARLLAAAAGEPTELWIDPGVGHTRLYAADPETYMRRVRDFFDRVLQPPDGRAPSPPPEATE